MKTQITCMVLMLWSIHLCAQENPYEYTMLRAIESLNKATAQEEYLNCAGQFERVAHAEKGKWLPYYYGAYSLILLSYEQSDATLQDQILDRAQAMLDRAMELEPGESELHALQAFLYPSRILVDPMARGMTYIEKIFSELEQAKALNPDNPRPWFLEGMNKLNLPPAMGGGPEVARPLLETAEEKFRAFAHENPLWPSWGADANTLELEKLQDLTGN